jgi:outer membrane protein, heavy metal efflux system
MVPDTFFRLRAACGGRQMVPDTFFRTFFCCVVAWLLVAGKAPRAQDSILGPIGGTTPFGAPVDVPAPAPLAAAEPLPPPPAAQQRPDMAVPQRPDTSVPPLVPSPALQVPGLALDTRPEPLTLAEVLLSVLMHYPLLQAVERERGIAAGRLTTAMGAFDTNVNMAGHSLAPGTYENYRSDFGLSQQFMFGGMKAFGGYRTGFGDFPTYNLAQKTADAGEFRGGLTMPLARDREIDRARATRAQAQLDVALAEPAIERSRLDYMRSAARTYWAWMGSGERYAAGERLAVLAIERDKQIELKVDGGVIANIERVDNQQNIALRNGIVIQADRAVQQAAIDLSLYHRDPSGKPLLAGRPRMQPVPLPVKPTIELYQQSLARAYGARPEFQRLALQREKMLVERRLQANQVLPGIDGQLVGNQDAGYGKSPLSGPNGLDRQVLQASLVFQMPAQRRDARGKLQTLESQLMQIDRQISYAEDQVRAEVQDAFSMLERAYEFHRQALKREELASLVASAEREQLRLGRSDILRVTLREQAKFEADILEIAARQEFWRAESDLRAADTSLGPESPGLLQNATPSPGPSSPARPPELVPPGKRVGPAAPVNPVPPVNPAAPVQVLPRVIPEAG